MAEQMTFQLPVRESRKRGDFFVSEANALAVARLEDVAGWPNNKLVLVGPEGSGKSHLAHVWAEANGGLPVTTVGALPSCDIPEISGHVAIEVQDHHGPATAKEEEAFFHFHNHMQSNAYPLLLIARTPPARWSIALPDLKSRMLATDVAQIDAPDDALLSAMLVKLFADRQLQIAPNLIPFLVTHSERSFAAITHLVAALDAAALAEKRAVTRTLARRVLDNLHTDAR